SGGDSPRVAIPSPSPSPSPSPTTSPTPTSIASPSPSPIPAPETVPVSAPDAAQAHPEKSAAQVQAEKHVRAAEAARKAGNVLRQLAEADQAHGLDPRNRRAAELMGEALVQSGDKTRGCPLLKRSRALYRQVGCVD
ncbi:MAG TPA: hypothetical protein VMZ28_10195, partial [Kofleriaceae bacterium]|nr:hypothetical protein [Kofleriaceae bacterium]